MDVLLSDRQRRFICRLTFLFCCIAPTLIVLQWILFPMSVDEWAQRIQRQIGVPITLDRIRLVSPQQTYFYSLNTERADADSSISVDHASVANTHRGRVVRLRQVQGSPQAIWETLNRIAANATCFANSARPVIVQVEQLILLRNDTANSTPERFQLAKLEMEITSGGQKLIAQCQHMASASSGTKITILGQNSIEGDTNWQIDTKGHLIPGWVLNRIVPQFRCLNDDCEISGYLTVGHSGQSWNGSFRGTINQVDLEKVVYRTFAQPLSGRANIQITSGRISDGRVVALKGRFHSEQGEIGPRLLQACTQWMSMAVVGGRGQSRETYRDLVFGFEIKNHQFAITGDQPSGILAYDPGENPLVYVSNGRRFPVSNLVSMLAFPLGGQRPLTREAESLARHLPLLSSSDLIDMTDTRQADFEVGRETFFK